MCLACLSLRFRRRDGYNVVNSEYGRFSNVLARFEADKMVGTSKARESVQVSRPRCKDTHVFSPLMACFKRGSISIVRMWNTTPFCSALHHASEKRMASIMRGSVYTQQGAQYEICPSA